MKVNRLTKKYKWADAPVQTAFPVSKAGYPYIYVSAFVTIIIALTGLPVFSVLGVITTLFICFFFRDPDRIIPDQTEVVISPADGRIVKAGTVASNPFTGDPAVYVGIFMSLFNVHVNRVHSSSSRNRQTSKKLVVGLIYVCIKSSKSKCAAGSEQKSC